MNKFNEKSRNSYNQKADNYDDTNDGRFTLKFKEMLLDKVSLAENDRVLDVACGNGLLLAMLNNKTSIKGFGVDISEQMIKNASTRNPSMEFHVAGCEKLPFEGDTMDVITVSSSYHHFPDVSAFGREASRVLKVGGKIYIAEIYLATPLRLLVNPFVPLSKAGDVRFYSPKGIIKNLSEHGFGNAVVDFKERYIQLVVMEKL